MVHTDRRGLALGKLATLMPKATVTMRPLTDQHAMNGHTNYLGTLSTAEDVVELVALARACPCRLAARPGHGRIEPVGDSRQPTLANLRLDLLPDPRVARSSELALGATTAREPDEPPQIQRVRSLATKRLIALTSALLDDPQPQNIAIAILGRPRSRAKASPARRDQRQQARITQQHVEPREITRRLRHLDRQRLIEQRRDPLTTRTDTHRPPESPAESGSRPRYNTGPPRLCPLDGGFRREGGRVREA